MAIVSGFHPSINGDRKVGADFFALFFGTLIGNGVFPNPSTGLQVVEGEGMQTIVRAGRGWINGYFISNDSDHILSHDLADGVLKRIDRIVMRLDHAERLIKIVVKKGAFASNPGAPILQRDGQMHELALADVAINNGAIAITQANITDTRLNTELCGIVHGLVKQVDTTTIFNQYQTFFSEWSLEQQQRFEDWIATLESILDGDVAGNLANQIINLENDFKNTNSNLKIHTENYIMHTPFVVAEGVNNYVVNIDNPPSIYPNGLCVVFAVKANSTNNATLKVNNLGTIPILLPNGAPVDDLKANGVYTVRYYNGNFILQGEGGGELKNLQPGEIILLQADSQRGNGTTQVSILKEAVLNISGTVRVSFRHWNSNTYGSRTTTTLKRNEEIIATYERSSGQVLINIDVKVEKGDVIKIEAVSSLQGEWAYVDQFRIKANRGIAGQITLA